jgi:hypothetical protein
VDSWNTAMIWALVFAAFAAIAVVITTRVALVRAKQLADVQEALINAKDGQLKVDLKTKDEKISSLDLDATKAKQDLASLQKAATDAKAAQQKVEIDLAKQREKTAGAEKALLELQASLADRNLTPPQRTSLTSLLKQWPGRDVDAIVWGGSAEVEIIAGQILECLADAGWQLHAGHSAGGGAVRGILVSTQPGADIETVRAADALVSALQSAGLASARWKFEEMTTPNLLLNSSYTGKASMRLFIGSKPPN